MLQRQYLSACNKVIRKFQLWFGESFFVIRERSKEANFFDYGCKLKQQTQIGYAFVLLLFLFISILRQSKYHEKKVLGNREYFCLLLTSK